MKKILFIFLLLPAFVMAQYGTTYDVNRVKTNRVTIPKDSSLFIGTAGVTYDNTSMNFTAPIKMTGSNSIYFNTTGYYIAGVSDLLIFNTPGTHLFRFAGNYKFQMTSALFAPYSNLLTDLGASTVKFGGLYSRNLTDTIGFIKVTTVVKQPMGTFADNDTSPSVAGSNVFKYNGTANSVSIVSLDDHVVGAFYTIIGNSGTYTITIVDGTPGGGDSFNLAGGNWVGGQDDVLVLYCYAADNFIEVSRSDN